MLLSIIIPVYNEERTIINLLEKVISECEKEHIDNEIIIVNDGSVDRTKQRIKSFIAKNRDFDIYFLSYKQNRGKGFALKQGFKRARGGVNAYTGC